jgi:serine/threonine protein kinase
MLSDFGRSRFIDHCGFTTAFAATVRYMAPELIAPETEFDAEDTYDIEAPPALTKETDIYAFSMLALEVSDSLFEVYIVSLDSLPSALCSPAYRGKLLRYLTLAILYRS